MNQLSTILFQALSFAAQRHAGQRRKDSAASPYINHIIDVTKALLEIGGVDDSATLLAAILHDTIEDTTTTGEELEARWGAEVRSIVEECTDDKRLPKAERKHLQVLNAPHKSPKARLVKIADKLCNITDVLDSSRTEWSLQRRREYLEWAEAVVAGLRGINPALEAAFDAKLAEKELLG